MALWYLLRAIGGKCLILLENQLIMAVRHINHVIGGKRTALFGYIIKISGRGNKGINTARVGNDIFIASDAFDDKAVKVG